MGARLYTTAEPTPTAVTARKDVRVSVRSLDKAFGRGDTKVTAVDKVSFDIGRGEFVALLGPSGCGKSTILNMVAGLIPRTGGDISSTASRWNRVRSTQDRLRVPAGHAVPVAHGRGAISAMGSSSPACRPSAQARVSAAIAQAGLDGFASSFRHRSRAACASVSR